MSQTSGMKIEHEGRLGWPLPKRREYFSKQVAAAENTHRVELMGETKWLPIIQISIDLARYRLENGRTMSAQQEYLATHEREQADLFTRDPESDHAQFAQHQLLSRLLDESGLLAYFKDPSNKQTEPMILDENGFVINGNRRLCGWRTLYWADPQRYRRYEYLDAVVLPHCDQKAIAKLEAALQVEPEIKADYTWDSMANMMLNRERTHNLTTKELAEFYRQTERDVKERLDMLEYAATYLDSRGKSREWSRVSGSEFAFQQLVRKRRKVDGAGSKQLFEAMAFALIDDPEGGRLYETIQDAQKYLPQIKAKLTERFPVKPSATSKSENLLGPAADATLDFGLAEEISKGANISVARKIIRDSIEDQEALEKDRKSVNFLVLRLAQVNSRLEEAVASGLRPESKKEGVAEQLQRIEDSIGKIRHWLDDA